MSFNFYFNGILAFALILFPFFYPKVISDINSKSITNRTLLLGLLFCITAISKPLDISDMSNIMTELSTTSTDIGSKFFILYPITSLDVFAITKLQIISFLSFFIIFIGLNIHLKSFEVNQMSYSLFVFSIYPLYTFHYRQFLSFSLVFLFLATYYRLTYSSVTNNRLYLRLCLLILPVFIYFTHPIYLVTIAIILVSSFLRCLSSRFRFNGKDLYIIFYKLKTKITYPLLLSLVLLLAFLPFAYNIYSTLLKSFLPSHAIYSEWALASVPLSKLLIGIVKSFLLFSPLIIFARSFRPFSVSDTSSFFLRRSFWISLNYVVSVSFAISIFIPIFAYFTKLYSVDRIGSAVYPLLILLPYNKAFGFMVNCDSSRLYSSLLLLLIAFKSFSYAYLR
ncbi:putative membrane protein [Synechococcus sp. RS9915]|nr:putative membrane protein [Synechococcus sp. RS9915]